MSIVHHVASRPIDQIASSSSSQYIFWVALRTFFHVAHVCCLLVVVLRGSVSPLAVVLPFSSVSTITTLKQFTTAFILTANFTPPLWTHCFLSCLFERRILARGCWALRQCPWSRYQETVCVRHDRRACHTWHMAGAENRRGYSTVQDIPRPQFSPGFHPITSPGPRCLDSPIGVG